MLADFNDFFERGRQIAQITLVFAFEGAAGWVDGEVICRVFDRAHVAALGVNGFPEGLHVVAVHGKAVFVEVEAGNL